jgi:uncharacterized protein YajQ (UPF0234 family)
MCHTHYVSVDVFFKDNGQYDLAKKELKRVFQFERSDATFNEQKKVITFSRQFSVGDLKNILINHRISFKEAHLTK